MSATDSKDVEMDPSMAASSSPVKPPSLSPPATSKVKDPFENELKSLNDMMNALSTDQLWPTKLQDAIHDPDELYYLLASVLVTLTGELMMTPSKSRYRPPMLTIDIAIGEINSMKADERDQLINALRRGIEKRNWEDLIRHRTFNSI
jgi:hypothetical protein